jgi:hypothetical protein
VILMLVDIFKVGQGLLIFLGIAILVMLIILLFKLIKTISSVNIIMKKNEDNIYQITDNIKDVTEVAMEVTASALDGAKSFQRYLLYIVDITTILKKIFTDKK